jgi:LysM domain
LKQITLILMVILLLTACNLNSNINRLPASDTPPPTRTLPFATDTDATQAGIVPDSTPDLPTTQATITRDNAATSNGCLPQADWVEYTIQRGDNLTNIAARTRSTVDELIAANCLDNPNRIRLGSTIFVPNAPE